MAKQYGLTPQGFVAKPQQQIISEITADLQGVFGNNINTGPESVFGQLIGIFSEREALLWQLAEAIATGWYPSGAEGANVDNILALNSLKRLAATASTVVLTLTGTPGTVIPAGSQAQTGSAPVLTFSTLATATIAAAVNCVQTINFTATPGKGAFALSIVDPSGNTLTTGDVEWMSTGAPGTSLLQSLVAPTTGTFQLNVGGSTTGSLNYNCTALQVQTAIRALTGYGSVTVTGVDLVTGLTITWTGVATAAGRITSVVSSTLDQTAYLGNALQDLIQVLNDSGAFPYAGATVSGSYSTGFVVTFAGTSGAQPQALFTVASDSLMNGATVVNVQPVMTTVGAPAQALATAQCTVNGPNFVPAGGITVIATPVSGWSGVNNALDTVPGTSLETDTQALQRRKTELAAQGTGTIQAIVEKVRLIPGISQAQGLENLSIAAFQTILFSAVPVSGSFKLQLGGPTGAVTAAIPFTANAAAVQTAIAALYGYSDVVVTGTFSIGFTVQFGQTSGVGNQVLALVSANTLGVTVTVKQGRPGKSFEVLVDYAGLPIINPALEQMVAQSIYGSKPAGIQAFGSSVLSTTGNTAAGSASITSLASTANLVPGLGVQGPGIPVNTYVGTVVGSTVTLVDSSGNAVHATLTQTGAALVFLTWVRILDAFGNPTYISFSKPTPVPIYVSINLTVSAASFPSNGVQQVQAAIVAIGEALQMGQAVPLEATGGIVGCFNSVPGIVSYTLAADTVPSPTNTSNIPIGSEQIAQIESFNILCTLTVVP